MNVFTDEAVHEAIRFLGIPDTGNARITLGNASVGYITAVGRLDSYLNVEMRVDPIRVPAYRLDDSGLWMSLTPMEVQSAWVAIQRAAGLVEVGGLGLGYAPLAMAAKPEVDAVRVFEIDADGIALFKELHGDRPEMKKIEIVHGDARKLLRGSDADFCWMDIYQSLLPDDVIEDIDHFNDHNNFSEYRFWGQELCSYVLGYPGDVFEKSLFAQHSLTDGARLKPPVGDEVFASRVRASLERWKEEAA